MLSASDSYCCRLVGILRKCRREPERNHRLKFFGDDCLTRVAAHSEDLAALAKKLPEGRLYGNGRGFVPNIRQSLYSEIIVTLAVEPQAAVGKDQDELPVATGLPRAWDEIAPGHLVIAQEALEYGWWEAIVIGRSGDMFTLRFRDYPKLPKFVRHRNAVCLDQPPGRIMTDGP